MNPGDFLYKIRKIMSLKVYYKDPNAPSPTQPLTPGVCAVILNKKGQILLHKREDNNRWTLPGGKMKVGESISDCCKREIEEELDIRVEIKKVVGIYTTPDYVFDFGKGRVFQPFVVAFLCSSASNKFAINEESEDAGWFSLDEISKLKVVPNTKRIVNHSLKKTDAFFD